MTIAVGENMAKPDIQPIIEALNELKNDVAVPKNIKGKIDETINALQQEGEISVKINKALQELEDIAEDTNMQPYTRTQIWNVVSMLEIF